MEFKSVEEARAAVNDKSSPYYERLWNGDKTVGDAVAAAYAKKNPETAEGIQNDQSVQRMAEGGKTTPDQIDKENPEQTPPADTQSEQVSGEPTPVDREVANILSAQWGDGHAENSQRAGTVLRTIFPTAEDMLEFG